MKAPTMTLRDFRRITAILPEDTEIMVNVRPADRYPVLDCILLTTTTRLDEEYGKTYLVIQPETDLEEAR